MGVHVEATSAEYVLRTLMPSRNMPFNEFKMFEYGVQRVPSRAKGLLLNWSHTDRPSLRIKLRRPFCDSGARHDEMTLRTVGKLVTLCVFVASNPWTEPNSRNQGTCKFSHPKLRTVTKRTDIYCN